MKRQIFNLTTNTAGAATSTKQEAVLGKLFAVEYLPGTLATGATVTVTSEGNFSKTLLSKASAGTSNVMFYPRELVNSNTDGAALTGTAGGDRTCPLVNGWIKVVIASGGSVATGQVVVYIDDK